MGYKFKSQYSGTCKNNPEHTWKVDEEVHYDKDKKIICTVLQCYLDQGGSPIEEKKKQFQGRKRLTAEEAKGLSKAVYLYAIEQASESLPEINLASDISGRVTWERRQIMDKKADMFYKGMIELMG
jgi:hypothetical protein